MSRSEMKNSLGFIIQMPAVRASDSGHLGGFKWKSVIKQMIQTFFRLIAT